MAFIMFFIIMAMTLTLSGRTSLLSAEYFPPLNLDKDYVCGLIDFHTYNSIPNVDANNNLFHVGEYEIEIPIGSYEIDAIAEYISEELLLRKSSIIIEIEANNNTMECQIQCNENIYFNKNRTIGKLLGFSKRVLEGNKTHLSDLPVDINKVNVIRVECNIITGSYFNNTPMHTIHEFSPETGSGYKIIEVPKNVIYLPVNVKRISTITLKLVDQNGDLINFRGERITVRLHLTPILE